MYICDKSNRGIARNILNMAETQVRLSVPEETHKKVLQLQGLFAFKEGKKTKINDLYSRVIERGIVEFMKQNR